MELNQIKLNCIRCFDVRWNAWNQSEKLEYENWELMKFAKLEQDKA